MPTLDTLYAMKSPPLPQLDKVRGECDALLRAVCDSFQGQVPCVLVEHLNEMRRAFIRFTTHVFTTRSSADVDGFMFVAWHMICAVSRLRFYIAPVWEHQMKATGCAFAALEAMHNFFNVAGISRVHRIPQGSVWQELPNDLQEKIVNMAGGEMDVVRALNYAETVMLGAIGSSYSIEYQAYRFVTKRVAARLKANELDVTMAKGDDWWGMLRLYMECGLARHVFKADVLAPCPLNTTPPPPMMGQCCAVCNAVRTRARCPLFIRFHNAFCNKPDRASFSKFREDVMNNEFAYRPPCKHPV